MKKKESGHGSVLVVTTQREDQRILFDALDGEDFEAVYTAKDPSEALAFLRQDPDIDVVLMEFSGTADEAIAFCTQLKGDARLSAVPVIGILPANPALRHWDWGHRPPALVDWLRSPIDAAEAVARMHSYLGAHPRDAERKSSAEHRDYRFAFDASPDEIVLSDPKTGAIIEVNTTFEQRSGVSRSQTIGQRIDSLNLAHAREQSVAVAGQLARGGSATYHCVRRRADGGEQAMLATVRLALQDGDLIHVTSFREQLDTTRQQAALDVIVKACESGGGDEGLGRITRLLTDWLELDFLMLVLVRPDQEPEAQPLITYQRFSLSHDAPDPLSQPTLNQIIHGEAVFHLEDAWKRLSQDLFLSHSRPELFVGIPLRDERQTPLGALLLTRRQALTQAVGPTVDALRVVAARIGFELDLRRVREQGRAKGLQDALTGLPNRLLFNDRLETVIKEAHRSAETFAVLFVDLDRFKSINDSLGHSVGDQVLLAVAKRLRASVRGSDTVARYAGDEFTMILRHIVQRDDVMRIAEKIVRIMEAPLTLADGSELHMTASIGVSFYPDDAVTAEHLLKYSDVAMYSAKGMGRNNFQAYVAVPEESHRQRLELEAKLRVAEKNNQLRVYYQPQVDAKTEDISGMEALIRWEHPELGMISPGFFIPLAEETGLILSIGEWVLRTACADARRWQKQFNLPLRIGVNLSTLQLRQPNLLQIVTSVLAETGLDPTSLDLELTESVSMKSTPNLMEALAGLRLLGCKISIDDFGTGQSSLDYIKRFPADRIKIDQSFVRNIGIDPDDEAIVRATIEMAHNLNRGVVAEGVETEDHFDFLRTAGCEELQGYLFCRPLSATSFENMLAERQRIFEETGIT